MYQIGDKVVYGIHGVCTVVGEEQKIVDRMQVTYLILEPIGQVSARFLVPTHNPVAMGKLKSMLTKDELAELISSEAVHTNAWIREENQRKQLYRELISSGDRAKLMQMIHTLYQHKAEQAAAGRKIHLCDENFLRDAEKLLMGEIAVVMGYSGDEAKAFVRNQLK